MNDVSKLGVCPGGIGDEERRKPVAFFVALCLCVRVLCLCVRVCRCVCSLVVPMRDVR